MSVTLWTGYNHPNLLKAFDNPHDMKAMINRPALGVYPGVDWVERLNNVLMSVAPQGMDQVWPHKRGLHLKFS